MKHLIPAFGISFEEDGEKYYLDTTNLDELNNHQLIQLLHFETYARGGQYSYIQYLTRTGLLKYFKTL